ncbi:MAG: GNAT family N-acetyltransferase [Candidatus Bathyarchaeia archaeon]|nr:GNAT family N-acetyltransferase [Candidatus Bathyarchaeota archaeon]
MIIRNVKKSDLESFIKLYIESYTGLESYAYTSRKDIKEYFSWLLLRDPDGFLIAELNEPVGFVACDANWFSHFEGEVLGEIHELFVHPKYRCSGIGSMLLERATEYARSKGRRIVGLWVGVENFNAKEFYEKRGFVETVSIGKWTRMIKKI